MVGIRSGIGGVVEIGDVADVAVVAGLKAEAEALSRLLETNAPSDGRFHGSVLGDLGEWMEEPRELLNID